MLQKLSAVLTGISLLILCSPASAGPRAYVSSSGSDSHPARACPVEHPCATFQYAHDLVDVGGQVIALDTGSYGTINVTKSVTIAAAPGVIAAIDVSAAPGVNIATPGVVVALRGLSINGGGAFTGVQMTAGDFLSLEDCELSNLGFGMQVKNAAKVRIIHSIFRQVSTGAWFSGGATGEVAGSQFIGPSLGFGITVQADVGTTSVAVSDSVATQNFTGFEVNASTAGATGRMTLVRTTSSDNVQLGYLNNAEHGGTALMSVASSTANGNAQYGFENAAFDGGTATFESLGNNQMHGNALGPTSGTITVVPGF